MASASKNVVDLTDQNFDQQVLQSDVPAIVDFWAEWCMPCKMLAPVIDELADEYAGRLKVGKVDVETNRNMAVKYNVTGIPTIMLFKGGQVVAMFRALQQKRDLKTAMDKILAGK